MKQEKDMQKDQLTIVQKLIDRNPQMTQKFFWEGCKGIFCHVISHLYSDQWNLEERMPEMINEFYLYLMENDARELRKFQGKSKLTSYLGTVAYRFFKRKHDISQTIEFSESSVEELNQLPDETPNTIKSDIYETLDRMSDKRSAELLRKLFDGCPTASIAQELGVSMATFYVLKQRAIKKIKVEYLQLRNYRYE